MGQLMTRLKNLTEHPLFKRAIGTAIYGPIFIGLAYLGGLPFVIGVAALALIGVYEFYRMAAQRGYAPSFLWGAAATLAVILDAYFKSGLLLFVLITWGVGLLIWLRVRAAFKGSGAKEAANSNALLANAALTFAGVLYIGFSLSHAILLRELPLGRSLFFAAMLGTAAGDIGAYMIGTNFGRHLLVPRLSPKKTWEGALGGILVGLAVTAALMSWMGISLIHGVVLGLLVGAFDLFGDLGESWLKRLAGVKDSGAWISGQGGLLDVIDGFLFVVVVFYYYEVWIIGS